MIIGTLVSTAFAIFLLFTTAGQGVLINLELMAIIPIVFAALSLILLMLTIGLAWAPLQKADQTLTSGILQLFRKDRYIQIASYWMIIFALISSFMGIDAFLHILAKPHVVAIWFILLGVTLDCWHYLMKRIFNYFNPFAVVQLFTREAILCIRNQNDNELCDWIDSLTEISIKAIERNSTSLSSQALDTMPIIAADYLESAKSISHPIDEEPGKNAGPIDQVSYTLFYLFQRLESINTTAAQKKLDPICSKMVTVLGKIAISSAKYDLTIVSYPVHFLGKFAKSAQENNMQDVAVKATLTLLEVSRVIITEVDIAYADLKDPFLGIITHLDEIAKETFRQDKSTNIKILIQPFRDLKELFKNEKVVTHQDTPVIVQNLDRIIGEFEALEMVLMRIPPIPTLSEVIPPEETK